TPAMPVMLRPQTSILLPYTTLFRSKIDEFKPSSRQNPFIRFNQDKKLHRTALEITGLSHTYGGGAPLFKAVDLMIESGEKIAVRSEEHTSELQSRENLVCRLLLVKK